MAGYLLIFSILLLIVLIFINNKSEVCMPNIIAGDADTIVTIEESRIRSNFIFFLDKEVFFKPKSVFIGKLIGNSMDARGIYCDDIVLGKKLKNPLEENFAPGDLLVIKITNPERRGYRKLKIREFKEELSGNKIQTVKYINNEKVDSAPHNKGDVIAIIDRFIKSNNALKRVII